MLSISKPIRGFDQGEYYLSLASVDDYYLDGKEPPGFWLGKGAQVLGLTGLIDPEDFRNLFRGFSPDGTTALVHNAGSPRRRTGWDVTWSVPKSVSTVWSQADDGTREEIEAAVHAAVREGVGYLETIGMVSRRGEDGVIRDQARLVFAAFPHSTSRLQDPQLHVHTILMNLAVRPNGSTGTIDPKELFRHQHAADALFRAELAAQLEQRLGLRAERVGRAFELAGVDRALMATFSKRRQEIAAVLIERGLSGAKAAEVVAFETRTNKKAVDRETLFTEWRKIGLQHGWSTEQVDELIRAPQFHRNRAKEYQRTEVESLNRLTLHDSHFARRDLTRALADEAQGRGLGAQDVYALRDTMLQTRKVILIGQKDREARFTTPEMLEIERRFLAASRQLHDDARPVSTFESLQNSVLDQHPTLSAEQRAAVEAVTACQGGLHLVAGMAGTGKSFAFGVGKKIWEAQGLEVLGGCLSGKAAAGLQNGSGIGSQTLHRLLWEIEHGVVPLHSRSVVLVDEAAMVGTRQLLELTSRCLAARAKLVLAGDFGQLQSVEAGGGFAALIKEFGASTLTEIKRQREEWARAAVKDFATGRAEQALDAYERRGLLHCETEPEKAALALIARWKTSAPPDPSDQVILAGTNSEVARLNALAQHQRLAAGTVYGEPTPVGEEKVYVNDRILFTRNSQSLGVFNGEVGTVTERHGSQLTVAMENGRLVSVNTNEYPHLRLGYALTTHKAQGMTIEQAFVLTGPMQNREQTYVQASRARGNTEFFLGTEDLRRTAERMARSQPKELASELGAAGPELELALTR